MKRTVSALCAIALAAGAAFAAGQGEATKAGGPGPVTAKPTKIVGYLLGSAPAGMPQVMAKINEKLKADLNAELEINYIGWADLNSRYPLVLAAGDGVDWIFTADWCQYAPEAARGAFAEITEDAVKRNMPLHSKYLDPAAWKQVKVNGKIYMIPTATPDRKIPVVIIRSDLRKKYGLPPIHKFSELEAYLAAVKKNESEMIPMNIDGAYDLGMPFDALYREFAPPVEPIQIAVNTVGSPFVYNPENEAPASYYSLEAPYAEHFLKAARIMKRWYDAGYLNKNPFANTVSSRDSFAQGKSAVGFGNSLNIQSAIAQSAKNGYDVEILPVLSTAGKYRADPFTNNGFAVAASSKNYDLTLRVMDRIMHESEYNWLVSYGIAGVNYALTADGKVTLPRGVTAETNSFPPDSSGFWFTNKDQHKPDTSWSSAYIEHRAKIKSYLTVTPYASFTFSPDKVKSEVATITNIWATYANPIMIGGAGTPEDAIENLKKKLEAANVAKVRAEASAQMKAFADGLK